MASLYRFIFFGFCTFFSLLQAQVTVNTTSGCAPLTNVQFSSPVSGNWVFGNGASATGAVVTANYANPGVFFARFNGDTVATITVYGNPSPLFSVSDSAGCRPFTTSFTDLSTGGGGAAITQWQWDFGDGGDSGNQNPSYTYTIAGDYGVILTVTDANGCDSSVVAPNLISVSNQPTASFTTTPNPAHSCVAPLVVQFNNTSLNSSGGTQNLSYEWDFGNGETSTLRNPTAVTYTQEGAYTVTLIVTQNGACSRTVTRNVTIGSPLANFTTPDTVCINTPIQFLNTSSGANSYQWTISGVTNYTNVNPTHTFNTAGVHTIRLRANSNQGCSGDTTKTIFVDAVEVDFTSNPTYLCQAPYCITYNSSVSPNVVTYNWQFGGQQSTDANPQICYPINQNPYYIHEETEIEVFLEAISANGCRASVVNRDTIFPVTAFFYPDVSQGCAPLTVQFSDSSRSREAIVSWEWDFGDGNVSMQSNPAHVYTNPGEYEVRLIVENDLGCRDTSYMVLIQVGEEINPLDFNVSNLTVCIGDTLFLSDLTGNPNIDFIHFETANNQIGQCDGVLNYFSPLNVTGPQDVTYHVNYNGCLSQNTVPNAFTVLGSFSEFYFVGDCAQPNDFNFVADIQGAADWEWDFGDGNSSGFINSGDSIQHTYAQTGDYTVSLTTRNASCADHVYTVEINVRNIQAALDVREVLCLGTDYEFTGYNSVDVDSSCNSGFFWDIGDQTPLSITGTGRFTRSFSDTGSYFIRLRVKDINGCMDTTEAQVRVTNIYPGIAADRITGCMPLTINFTDTTQSDSIITFWQWRNVTNNVIISDRDTASITLTNVTQASTRIRLTVRDSLGCQDETDILINPILPDTNFVANRINSCAGDSILFTPSGGAAIQSFTWNFGDSSLLRVANNPNHAYALGGTYSVTLSVVDTNGCNGQRTRLNYINIQDYPQAGFSTNMDSVGTLCYPISLQYTDTSISNYTASRTWNLGTGGAVVPNPQVSRTYTQPGTYQVSLIRVTSFGCADTAERELEIVGPTGDFSISQNTLCVGESVTFGITQSNDVATFGWDFGDGQVEMGGDPVTHQYTAYPDGGSTVVQFIMFTQDSACSATRERTIQIREVEARFDMDSILCINSELTVINQSLGADNTSWNFGNGFTTNEVDPDPVGYQNLGGFEVRLIVENIAFGCIDTLIKEGVVVPFPQFNLSDVTICEGDSVQVTVNSNQNITLTWEPNNIVQQQSNLSATLLPNFTTDVNVSALDDNGCENTVSFDLILLSPQDDIFIGDTCVVIGDQFTIGLDLGSHYTYSWENSSDVSWINCLTCPVLHNAQITQELGNLDLVLRYTDSLSCYHNFVYFDLCVLPSYTVSLPDAFTPDGDGVNDVIRVRGHGIKELVDFKIYNRWGEIVFETNDITQGWDGFYKNDSQNQETYLYQVTVIFFNDKPESKSGSFTLFR